jgi:hypothetical protein
MVTRMAGLPVYPGGPDARVGSRLCSLEPFAGKLRALRPDDVIDMSISERRRQNRDPRADAVGQRGKRGRCCRYPGWGETNRAIAPMTGRCLELPLGALVRLSDKPLLIDTRLCAAKPGTRPRRAA